MHKIDLETLYKKIDGHITLTSQYFRDEPLVKIIKSCRLKPHSIFIEKFHPGARCEKHWIDEFDNSLYLDKKYKIMLNHTLLGRYAKISTDLFYGRSVSDIADFSKFVLVSNGNYFDRDIYLVAFYGQDEYIRAFVFNKKWYRVSPLLFGINTLREMFSVLGVLRPTTLDNKKLDIVIPFDLKECVAMSLTTKQDIGFCFDNNGIRRI